MRQKVDEEVSVVMYYSAKKKLALPHVMSWQGEEYDVGEIGYHHRVREGDVLHHIYEFVDKTSTYWFRLNFNTASLHWTLETISDGNAD